MSLAARCKCRRKSLVEARPAEFGVGDDRTVEVRLAEVRLLLCYFFSEKRASVVLGTPGWLAGPVFCARQLLRRGGQLRPY